MQHILFHDVDGCLNTSDGAALPFESALLDKSQKATLRSLGEALDRSNMDMMVLNTGRSMAASVFIAEHINSAKLKYVIAEHGALGYSMHDSNYLDFAFHAKDLPHLNDVYASLERITSLVEWYDDEGAELLSKEIKHLVGASPKRANLTLGIPEGVSGKEMLRHLRYLIEHHSPVANDPLVYHHSVSDGYVDVMAEVDKGDGVQLIRHLESEHQIFTYAVGNGSNDLPMFKHVDVCICPSNSDEPVFAYCKANKGVISEHAFIDATLDLLERNLS